MLQLTKNMYCNLPSYFHQFLGRELLFLNIGAYSAQ
jgi:hypothetical protein